MRMMRALITFFIWSASLFANAGERVTIMAELTETTPVQLSDGAKWNMDKGDCFPIIAYKESHTVVILQLAKASFIVPANKIREVAEKDLARAQTNYRANVNTYLNGYAARWRSAAEAEKNKNE
jgi:hypothetical protein